MSATQTKRQDSKRQDRTAAQPIEPLYSIRDLATILNVSRRTIERDIAVGEFPGPDLRVGKMPRWKPETVRAWMDSQARNN